MVRLFVYGSLQRGFSNAGQLEGSRFIARCRTEPGYRLVRYRDGYPALVHLPHEQSTVQGELYEIDSAHLARLDRFEECPELYQRAEIKLEDGRTAAAYLISAAVASSWPLMASGVWSERA